MSYQDETRVVDLQFNNKQFEANVSQTLTSLDKLDAALKFENAEKGFKDLEKAASKVDMSGLEKAVDSIESRFTSLGAMLQTKVLDRITDSILNIGQKTMKMFSTDAMTAGWGKYEQQVGAVQTIMNSTGDSMATVSKWMEKLSWYTDETSYYFSDMVNNISKFTSQGIGIADATDQMIGIANAAGLAGVNAESASHAMEGFAKAMSRGYMDTLSWKWIQTAKMETPKLKQAFIDAAEGLNVLRKTSENTWEVVATGEEVTIGTFYNTLKDKWVNSDVMQKVLKDFGSYSDRVYEIKNALDAAGGESFTTFEIMERLGKEVGRDSNEFKELSDALEEAVGHEEAVRLLADDFDVLGEKGMRASQETKTFADLVGALQEVVGSGWRQTFDIIIGNYEEAKDMWSMFAEDIWDTFAIPAETRNELLQLWKDMGGRDDVIKSLQNIFQALLGENGLITKIKEAFQEIFPPKTAADLADMTRGFEQLTESLIMSDDAAEDVKEVFKAFFSILKPIATVLQTAFKVLRITTKLLITFGKAALSSAGGLEGLSEKVQDFVDNNKYFKAALITAIAAIILIKAPAVAATIALGALLAAFVAFGGLGWVRDRIADIGNFFTGKFIPAIQSFHSLIVAHIPWLENWGTIFEHIGGIVAATQERFAGFSAFLSRMYENHLKNVKSVRDVISVLWSGLKTIFNNLKNSNIVQTILNALKTGFTWLHDNVPLITEDFSEFANSISSGQVMLLVFAAAILILIINVNRLIKKLTTAVGLITNVKDVFGNLNKYLMALTRATQYSALIQIGIGLGLIAAALVALTYADWDYIWQAVAILGGFAVLSVVLLKAATSLAKVKAEATSFFDKISGAASIAITMIGLSGAIFLFASAIATLGAVDWNNTSQIVGSLAAIIGVMLAFTLAIAALGKHAPKIEIGAAVMLSFAGSIYILAQAMAALNGIPNLDGAWAAIASMGAIFAALTVLMGRFKTGAGVGLLTGVVAMRLYVGMLPEIFEIVNSLPDIRKQDYGKWAVVIGGLIAIGAALGIAGQSFKTVAVAILAGVLAFKIALDAFAEVGPDSPAFQNALAAVQALEPFVTSLVSMLAIFNTISTLMGAVVWKGGSVSLGGRKSGMFSALIGLSVLLIALAGTLKILSTMDIDQLDKLVDLLSELGFVFAAMLMASKLAENSAKGIRSLTTAILAMAGVVMVMSLFTKDGISQLREPALLLAGLMVSLGLALGLAGKAAGNINGKTIVAMCSTIVLCGSYLGYMAAMGYNWNDLLPAAGALAATLIAVGTGMAIASKAASGIKTSSIVALCLMTLLAGGYLAGMAALGGNWDTVLAAAAGIGIVCLALATSLLIASKASAGLSTKAILAMLGMTLAAGGMLIGLTALGATFDTLIPFALSFGIILLSLAGSLLLASKASAGLTPAAVIGMLGLAATCGLMLLIFSATGATWDTMMPIVVSFGIVLLSLAGSLFLAGLAAKDAGGLIIGVIAMIAAAVTIGGMLAVLSLLDMEKLRSSAISFGIAIAAVTAACLLLGVLAGVAIPGAVALMGISAACVGFGVAAILFAGAGALFYGTLLLMSETSEETQVKIIQVLGSIGAAIGLFLANVIAGIGLGIGKLLELIGVGLEKLLTLISKGVMKIAMAIGSGIEYILAMVGWGAANILPMIKAGIFGGLDDAVANMVNGGAALANGIFEGFNDAAEIHSPSLRGFISGKLSAIGIKNGLASEEEQLESTAAGLGGSVMGTLGGYFNFENGESLAGSLVAGIQSGLGNIGESIGLDTSAINSIFSGTSKNLWAEAAYRQYEDGKYYISNDGREWKEIEWDKEHKRWKYAKDDVDGFSSALEEMMSGLGATGGSLGKTGKSLKATEEDAAKAREEFEYYNDVMNYASETTEYFTKKLQKEDATLMDVDAEKIAISKTQEMIMAHSDLIGTLDESGNAITDWAQLTEEQVREAGAAWEEYYANLKGEIANKFDYFTNPFENWDDSSLPTFTSELEKMTNSAMGAEAMGEALERLSGRLVDPLLQRLAGDMDLGKILAWDKFSDEEINELNAAYIKWQDSIDKATNLTGLSMDQARKNTVAAIKAGIDEAARLHLSDAEIAPLRANMLSMFERVLDAEDLGDLFTKSTAAGFGSYVGQAFLKDAKGWQNAIDEGTKSVLDLAQEGLQAWVDDQVKYMNSAVDEAFHGSETELDSFIAAGQRAAAVGKAYEDLEKGIEFINEAGTIGKAVNLDQSVNYLKDSNWDLMDALSRLGEKIDANTAAVNAAKVSQSSSVGGISLGGGGGGVSITYNTSVSQDIHGEPVMSERAADTNQKSAGKQIENALKSTTPTSAKKYA